MGIKGLMKLIADNCPDAIKEHDMSSYFGRKVAIDASMCLYQFLIAVRSGPEGDMLTNADGEVTSHLQGMFYRTIRLIENGIKPVYVFDGKPPVLKGSELEKRKERREQSELELKQATEEGNQDEINKMNKRLTYVTKQHNADAKRLLTLLGIPIIDAPSEAEAQCAVLCRSGAVYGVATEDMDCLTFGSSIQLRHMTASASKNLPITEIKLEKVLNGLQLNQDEFTQLCILCGCDYTNTIKGIGPQKALKLIQEHKNIDEAMKHIDMNKHSIDSSSEFLYNESAELFSKPDIIDPSTIDLKWLDCDDKGLIEFLCHEKGFDMNRVEAGIKRLKQAKNKGNQQRMDSFFTMIQKEPSNAKENNNKNTANTKRKTDNIVNGKLKKGKVAVSKKK